MQHSTPPPVDLTTTAPRAAGISSDLRRALIRFGVVSAGLLLAFSPSLVALVRMAAASELYSYILLMPAVVVLFSWWRSASLLQAPVRPSWMGAGCFVALGIALVAARRLAGAEADALPEQDQLAWSTAPFLAFLLAAAFACFGTTCLGRLAGPIAMLAFIIPFPVALESKLETFLQHGSALMAEPLFALWGTPLFRDDLTFRLPGVALHVAPECSGIHSTVVLFITSLVACLLLLKRPSSRITLVALIVPLALLRNGFRIFVIGQLSVDYGPEMLNSWIHRSGGPLFFVLSLIPLLALAVGLVRWERRRQPVGVHNSA